jgi:hypothetical protein
MPQLSTVRIGPGRETWAIAAGVLVLAPIVYALATVEALGLQDLPVHLLVARLAATAPEDLPAGVAHVQVPLLFPYHLIYPILELGGRGSEHAVARVLLLFYLLAATGAVVAIGREFRRFDPWNALAAIPLAVSMVFWSGFIVYLLAIPVFLWLLWAELRRLGPMDMHVRRRLEILIAAGFLILYLLHPLVLLMGVWVSLTAGAVALRRRGTAVALWPRLVGAALGLASMLLVIHAALARGTPLTSGGDDLVERVALLFGNTFVHFGPVHRPGAKVASVLLLAGLFLRWYAGSRSGVSAPGSACVDRDRTVVLASAWGCCLIATLVIPFFAGPLAYAGTRFALPTLLLSVALLAGPLGPKAGLTRLAIATHACAGSLVLAGAFLLSTLTAAALDAVAREIAPVRALGQTLARSGVVPSIVRITFEPRSSAVSDTFCLGATAHVYALLESGAVDAELFDNPFLPVALVGDHPRAPNIFQPERYDRRQARGATHVLLRLPGLGLASTSDARRVVARLRRDFVLDSRAGPWLLWRRSAPWRAPRSDRWTDLRK